MALDKLPEPDAACTTWPSPATAGACHMAGVGGMGIGVVGAILVRAGHKEGYRVRLPGQEGPGHPQRRRVLADHVRRTMRRRGQASGRTGSTQRLSTRTHAPASIPYGQADLLLGIDILEAARAVDPREQFRVAAAGPHGRRAEPVQAADRLHAAGPARLRSREAARGDLRPLPRRSTRYAKNLSELCEQRLGSKQFVNIMMLGVAYQLGLIPVVAALRSPGRSRTRSGASTARTSRPSTSAASSRWSRARCPTKPEPRDLGTAGHQQDPHPPQDRVCAAASCGRALRAARADRP